MSLVGVRINDSCYIMEMRSLNNANETQIEMEIRRHTNDYNSFFWAKKHIELRCDLWKRDQTGMENNTTRSQKRREPSKQTRTMKQKINAKLKTRGYGTKHHKKMEGISYLENAMITFPTTYPFWIPYPLKGKENGTPNSLENGFTIDMARVFFLCALRKKPLSFLNIYAPNF